MDLEPVDQIVHAGWVLPIEPPNVVLEQHCVVIERGRIEAVMPSGAAATRYRATREWHLPDQLLMPGLVNAHGHAAMTLLRGLADDHTLTDWLHNHIWPAEGRWVSEDFVRTGTRLAIAEMLCGGTTCFSDMYFFPDAVATAVLETGCRAQIAFPILDHPSAWAASADEYISKGLQVRDRFKGNPRLGFVCVSEDMTGEFGFCGYFREYDEPLAEHERLRFAREERPPPFDPARQPAPPSAQWPAERLAKAARNYAIEYVRNCIVELAKVAGEAAVREHAGLAARLIGMQYRRATAERIGAADGGAAQAADYLARMFTGMGDQARVLPAGSAVVQGATAELPAHVPGDDAAQVRVQQQGLRIVRGLPAGEARLLFDCWQQLWVGAVRSHAVICELQVAALDGGDPWAAEQLVWTVGAPAARSAQ